MGEYSPYKAYCNHLSLHVFIITTLLLCFLSPLIQSHHHRFTATTISLPMINYNSLSSDQQNLLTTTHSQHILDIFVEPTSTTLNQATFKEESALSYLTKTLFSFLIPNSSPGETVNIFDHDEITWIPVSAQPSFFDLLLPPFSTIELIIASNTQFDVIITNSLQNRKSFGTEFKSCNLVDEKIQTLAAQRVKIQENAIQKHLDGIYDEEQLLQKNNTDTAARNKVMTSIEHNNINITNWYSSQRELHLLYENALIADTLMSYQCTISLPMYSYYSPFSTSYVGISIQKSMLSKIREYLSLFSTSSSSQSGNVILSYSYKTQPIHFPTLFVAIFGSIVFFILPNIIETTLFHQLIGTSLVYLIFLLFSDLFQSIFHFFIFFAILLYTSYKLTSKLISYCISHEVFQSIFHFFILFATLLDTSYKLTSKLISYCISHVFQSIFHFFILFATLLDTSYKLTSKLISYCISDDVHNNGSNINSFQSQDQLSFTHLPNPSTLQCQQHPKQHHQNIPQNSSNSSNLSNLLNLPVPSSPSSPSSIGYKKITLQKPKEYYSFDTSCLNAGLNTNTLYTKRTPLSIHTISQFTKTEKIEAALDDFGSTKNKPVYDINLSHFTEIQNACKPVSKELTELLPGFDVFVMSKTAEIWVKDQNYVSQIFFKIKINYTVKIVYINVILSNPKRNNSSTRKF